MSEKSQIFTIANFITVLRVLLAPVVLIFLYAGLKTDTGGNASALFICIGLMIIAELTDMLDGMVARKLNQVSDVGKLLDPLSDSLYRSMIFLGFLALGIMPLWMVIIVVSRDIIVAYTRIFAGLQNVVMGARQSGKIKAIVQGFGQIATVAIFAFASAGVKMPFDQATVIFWILFAVTAVTAYSMIDYVSTIFKTQTINENN